MFAYAARQSIFDQEKNVIAYELLFRDGEQNCFPDVQPDEATSKLLTGSHLTTGIEEITDGKLAFINFHEDTLLYRFPTFLDPSLAVIEIVETVPISKPLISACKHIRDLGYKIALDDHDFDPKWDAFLPYIHIIKIDVKECDLGTLKANLPKFKEHRIKLVAEKIETEEEFQVYKALDFDFFQGYFFAMPELMKQKNIPTSKLTMLELMQASSSADFDFEAINNIIEKDVALSYMLLRFINNPIHNKRNKITSLKHALNYMGEVEVKKFVALLALANLQDGKPAELTKLSLVRAKFCELIARSKGEQDNPPMGFLVGLFSLLDALLDKRMENLMEKLPLCDDLKQALCGTNNALRRYLALARSVESGNWARVDSSCNEMQLDQRMVQQFHLESMKWGNAMASAAQG